MSTEGKICVRFHDVARPKTDEATWYGHLRLIDTISTRCRSRQLKTRHSDVELVRFPGTKYAGTLQQENHMNTVQI